MMTELAIGDAYGAGFEYSSKEVIENHNDLTHYIKHQKHDLKPGYYTDDTQMSIAIAEILLENDDLESVTKEMIAQKFVDCFHRDKREGYASGFYSFLIKTKTGKDFVENIRPKSDKSGAAMRAGPIGLIRDSLMRTKFCRLQASLTHDTEDGINAALASTFLTNYFAYNKGPKNEVGMWIDGAIEGDWITNYKGKVGAKGWMSVKAAITAVRRNDSMSAVLKDCINFTGDVDTVATIALSAASFSKEIKQDLPDTLLYNLEGTKYGRKYLQGLDKKLIKKFINAPITDE